MEFSCNIPAYKIDNYSMLHFDGSKHDLSYGVLSAISTYASKTCHECLHHLEFRFVCSDLFSWWDMEVISQKNGFVIADHSQALSSMFDHEFALIEEASRTSGRYSYSNILKAFFKSKMTFAFLAGSEIFICFNRNFSPDEDLFPETDKERAWEKILSTNPKLAQLKHLLEREEFIELPEIPQDKSKEPVKELRNVYRFTATESFTSS